MMSELFPLPELPPPPGVEACALCQLSRQRSRVIWAEGRPGAPLMVLLDNPGAREDAEGNPFVCGTRQALREAARAAGIADGDLLVTWVLKCRPRRAYDKEAARAACLPYLGAQLAEHRPRGDRMRPTVFGYHPLAVRRRPNLMVTLVEDLRLAVSYLAGRPGHHPDP